MSYSHTVSERFLRYAAIDTQSDPHAERSPSTEKQKDLSRLLVEEFNEIGLSDVSLSEEGYVYAHIPSNSAKQVPTICFCSHVDTAPDCSGTGVKPIVHRNYQGVDIVLPDDASIVLSQQEFPHLREMIGEDIITASGLTLLGSDDKAGVAEIVDLANILVNNPQIVHGKISILITTDEEVGRGTQHVDLKKVGADFGYTLDGGEIGAIEDQTFSADGVKITVQGVISHPGYAKDKLVNALKIAGEILAELPKGKLSPESTEGMQGFFHPVHVEGAAEECSLSFIIRDFKLEGLAEKEAILEGIAASVVQRFPGAKYKFEVKEQYRNMKEILDQHPQVVEYAAEAMRRIGVEPRLQSIRGGTDGSKLSFMGLPCANLSAGQRAIHSKKEHISIQEMEKIVSMLVELVQVWEERS